MTDLLAMLGVFVVFVGSIELWRRSLRRLAPGWLVGAVMIVELEIVVGALYGAFHGVRKLLAENADLERTAMEHRDSANEAHMVAFVGIAVAVVLLVIGDQLRRRPGPPTARVRS